MSLFPSARPAIRVRVLPRFPADVQGSGLITVSKSGLTYTFSYNQAALPTIDMPALDSGAKLLVRIGGAYGEVDVSGFQAAQVAWANVTDIPSQFPPQAHQHPFDDITGLQATLDSKLNASQIGVDVQAYDADLAALAALTGTNTIYYRSGISTWSPVTIGTGITFSGGTLSAAQSAPIGAVMPYAGSSAPSGWLLCAGQEVSRTTYAALDAVIGTTYGSYTNGSGGAGTTHLRLPDLRGRAVFGRDDMGGSAAGRVTNSGIGNPGINGAALGATGGADRHTLTTAQMPSHSHSIGNASGGNSGGAISFAGQNGIVQSAAAGGSEAHPQMPPAIILNFIIYAGV